MQGEKYTRHVQATSDERRATFQESAGYTEKKYASCYMQAKHSKVTHIDTSTTNKATEREGGRKKAFWLSLGRVRSTRHGHSILSIRRYHFPNKDATYQHQVYHALQYKYSRWPCIRFTPKRYWSSIRYAFSSDLFPKYRDLALGLYLNKVSPIEGTLLAMHHLYFITYRAT